MCCRSPCRRCNAPCLSPGPARIIHRSDPLPAGMSNTSTASEGIYVSPTPQSRYANTTMRQESVLCWPNTSRNSMTTWLEKRAGAEGTTTRLAVPPGSVPVRCTHTLIQRALILEARCQVSPTLSGRSRDNKASLTLRLCTSGDEARPLIPSTSRSHGGNLQQLERPCCCRLGESERLW